ncbi:MAG: DUF92 domain-containing protein [Candidatus Aminicenantes bacterium]|nr:DUF92 domain-containing protein [Candidatus Aminicenantes bacterium]
MRNRGEDLRQLEHVLPLAFAFLLPYVDYRLILGLSLLSFFYAAFISPRWIRVTTRDSEREAGFSPGKLYYAFGIMILLLLFRERLHVAAAVWAVLAVGDAVSNLAGRRWPWVRLPYNREKSLGGSIGFFLAAAVGSWTLLVWNLPQADGGSYLKLAACCIFGSLVCALAESLPNLVDDNLVIVVVGAGIFPLLLDVPDLIPELSAPWSHAVGINFLLAGLAVMVGWISWRGGAAGVVLGIGVYLSAGPAGYAVLCLFFFLGGFSTWLGTGRKEALGVAEENLGRRGVANVLSKGLVAGILALLFFWTDSTVARVAYTGALAAAAMDTVATEIGQWLGRAPRSLRSFEPVAVGTPGAISLIGTLAGLVAALAVSSVPAVWNWTPASALPALGAGAIAGNGVESWLAGAARDAPGRHQVLNLYNTLAGACVSGGIWIVLSSPATP